MEYSLRRQHYAALAAAKRPAPAPLPDRYSQDEVKRVVSTNYVSLPVKYPADYLAPVPDPSVMKYKEIDFKAEGIPQYEGCYAAVLDNVMSPEECRQLLYYIEQSAGLHRDPEEMIKSSSTGTGKYADISKPGEGMDMAVGWQPARVPIGANKEVMVPDYRRSMRIIWDEKEITSRIWNRMNQIPQVKEYFDGDLTDEKKYPRARGVETAKSITLTEQGLNERMRCLKYESGDFFSYHSDGAYASEDGKLRTYYTIQLYLNDSIQALGLKELPEETDKPGMSLMDGGSTTFKASRRAQNPTEINVWPKAGRVLVFQHKDLGHIGGEVREGTKYTIRSDIQYKLE